MSHEVLIELEWIGALLVVMVAFAASSVVLTTALTLPERVKKSLLWLAAAGFLGSAAVGTPTILSLAHVPVDHVLWNAHALFFLGSAVTYTVAAHHFAALSHHLNKLSRGTEDFG